jgi:putative membrane protein
MLATPLFAMLLMTSPVQAAGSATGLAAADREFAMKAAKDGQAEVELATMAEKKATSDKARSLAAQLRTDHDRANAELMEIARRKGANLDPAPGDEHKQMSSKLSTLTGASFDREYSQGMVKDHQKAIQLFEREAREGQDADLKAFATKTLPTLREHLRMAQAAEGGASQPGSASQPRR